MYRPRTGCTLNGESEIPCCAWKIGPSRNGLHATVTPRPLASASIRLAAGYE